MSDQMTPDLETRLQGWLAGRAPAEVPADFAQRIAAIPRSAPRARPVRVTGISGGRRASRPMLLAAATVALTLALIAGGLFIATSRHDATLPLTSVEPTVTPTPTPPPTPAPTSDPTGVSDTAVLPAVIPDAVEHGVVDTPLGSARWVHLQGDPTTLPEPFSPIVTPDGSLAWFQPGGPGVACFNDPQSIACTDPPRPALSISSDVLSPREPWALPIDAAHADLRLIGDTFWLVTSDPLTVWRSGDLQDWHQTDITGLVSPGPAAMDWVMTIAPDSATGDATIASVTFTARDSGSLVGHPGQQVHLVDAPAGGYAVKLHRSRKDGGDIDAGPITIEKTAGGLRFLDAKRKEVGRVDGVGQGFIDDWVRRGEITYNRLASSDGETWSMAELPVTQPVDWPLVVPLKGGAMVFVTEPDAHVRAWRTVDGRTWTGGTPIVDATGIPIASSGVTYRGSVQKPVIVAIGTDGTSSWTSTDGDHWVLGPDDSSVPAPVQFDHGFMRTGDQTPDGTWQVSRDGTTFEDVPALQDVIDKIAPGGAGGSGEFAIGDTVFFSVTEDEGSQARDLWMIEFPAPGR